ESVDFVDIKPFDLVFFINDKNRVHHVGIALENSQIIHASGQVKIDSLTNEGIIHSLSNELTHRLHSIKRILE
ncbi:MAG: NlpC/P60 family protein, partial [Bacteroidota bacterium]|nr:NlpC/P60 family protein [Bacteroidota bacterium]